MKINIGISEKNLSGSVDLLSCALACETILYLKTRKAHWNVAGPSFMELHKLFQEQYSQVESAIDEIAERIGKLGHPTIGTTMEFTKLSKIKEHPGKYLAAKETIKELLGDHETMIITLRSYIETAADKNKDSGTADFLTGLMEQHETMAWILRRYLS